MEWLQNLLIHWRWIAFHWCSSPSSLPLLQTFRSQVCHQHHCSYSRSIQILFLSQGSMISPVTLHVFPYNCDALFLMLFQQLFSASTPKALTLFLKKLLRIGCNCSMELKITLWLLWSTNISLLLLIWSCLLKLRVLNEFSTP